MSSEYFHCPQCNERLKKSAAAFVLGHVGNDKLLDSLPSVTCPACGASIPARFMIKGPPTSFFGKVLDVLADCAGFALAILIIGGVVQFFRWLFLS